MDSHLTLEELEYFTQLSNDLSNKLGIDSSAENIASSMYLSGDPEATASFDAVAESYASEGITRSDPFVGALVQKEWNQFTFTCASCLNSPGTVLPLSPYQVMTLPFAYLTHRSELKYITRILSEGALKPFHGRKRANQYPGVYCFPNMQRPEEAYSNMSDTKLTFVLSLALLKKRAWHLNRCDDYGNITMETWDYATLPEHLMGLYGEASVLYGPTQYGFMEVVFHDRIPLEYVEAVVVKYESDVDEALALMYNSGIPVYSLEEWKSMPLIKRVKGLSSHGLYTDDAPNFCFNNMGGGGDDRVISASNIRCTLLNSGFKRQVVDRLMSKMNRREILKYIQELWEHRLETGEKYPPAVHPPY